MKIFSGPIKQLRQLKIPLKGNATTNRLSVDQKINVSQALVENVGFYQGKSVNLLVTLKRNKSNLKGGSLSFTKDYFLGIDIAGEVMVTYQFVDANQNPLTIKTALITSVLIPISTLDTKITIL
ncbi:hypothetical protein [Pediococcus pentosaceus]|uniref:hypothetical protein n=1 Tax=Pediococcus pentosaceus TaxID=1255 RepID=UPI00200CE46C|nr:hypothetical protein [Pediococcus pentosaceus]UQA99962.1 hypothetical protein Ped0941_04930 [Pediococcus pentosaceus]UQB01806.1 hypothetical protein Ped0620_04925 [Pediococcus pentosaceus]